MDEEFGVGDLVNNVMGKKPKVCLSFKQTLLVLQFITVPIACKYVNITRVTANVFILNTLLYHTLFMYIEVLVLLFDCIIHRNTLLEI